VHKGGHQGSSHTNSPIYQSYWYYPNPKERHAEFCSGQIYVWPSNLETLKVHTNNKVTITACTNGEDNIAYNKCMWLCLPNTSVLLIFSYFKWATCSILLRSIYIYELLVWMGKTIQHIANLCDFVFPIYYHSYWYSPGFPCRTWLITCFMVLTIDIVLCYGYGWKTKNRRYWHDSHTSYTNNM
jgi:hypothetical protein